MKTRRCWLCLRELLFDRCWFCFPCASLDYGEDARKRLAAPAEKT